MQQLRLGLSLHTTGDAQPMARAQWAERQGFESVWLPDGGGGMHALTLAGAVAQATRRVRVGTAIVPVYTHSPAVLASAAAALHHLAAGRTVLGLGASSAAMMQDWHGIPFQKPRTRVAETLQVLRAMLRGERPVVEGETVRTRGFRLNAPVAANLPLHIAALRPGMLHLAGAAADGVILHLVPLRALPRVLQAVADGASGAGRGVEEVEVVCRFNVLVTDDLAAGRDAFRRFVSQYFFSGVYNQYFRWAGFGEAAEEAQAGFAAGDRARTAAAISDAVVDALGLVGSAASIVERLRAFAAGGVQTAILHPLGEDAAAQQTTLDALAREAGPSAS